MIPTRVAAPLVAFALAACSSTPLPPPTGGHLGADDVTKSPIGSIPAPVQASPTLARPRAAPKTETYSVVVSNIRVQELLFALARDAKLNVDIHPGIEGVVTLNAIDQTLQQLLTRIAKQVDMRWELDGPNLVVMPDTPFLRTYKVNYVNMARDVTSTIASSNSVASGVTGGSGGSGGGAAGNVSTTEIKNVVKNRFWETLEKNLKDLLRETDKILPEGSSETVIERADQQATTAAQAGGGGRAAGGAQQAGAGTSTQQTGTTVLKRTTFREAASVIVNDEAGIVTVRATSRQQEKVQEYLSSVMASARRQVLIEATIVEVALNDGYSQGIDWSRLRADGSGFTITSPISATANSTLNPFVLKSWDYSNPLSIVLSLKLLQTFGNVKVLSSPRLSVLNNQTAILRVVENFVYFKVDASQNSSVNTGVQTSINTTPQTVQVGLTMAVTPQISENDTVILDVRPTITQISKMIQDPNPQLTNIQNNVPQLRTREMESVMRVNSGDIAVLGGLMEDGIDYTTNRIPLIGAIPLIGEIFTNRANTATKTELVVFIRPVVLKDASIAGDYADYKGMLPDKDFFTSETARHAILPPLEPARESR
jgi:MSHA type pilus biogenesis protein MshL